LSYLLQPGSPIRERYPQEADTPRRPTEPVKATPKLSLADAPEVVFAWQIELPGQTRPGRENERIGPGLAKVA